MLTDKLMDISQIYTQTCLVFPHFHRNLSWWEDTYRSFLARTLTTRSDREHALLMAEFVNTLGDGHTDVSFSKAIRDEAGYLPFDIAYAGGKYYLEGERVLQIDGRPMDGWLQEISRYCYRVDSYIPRLCSFLPLLMKRGPHEIVTTGSRRAFSLVDHFPKGKKREALSFSRHGDILCIRLDDFLQDRSGEIREKLEKTKPRAVILDIRENIGGMTLYGANVAQLFLPGVFGGCQKWTRTMTGVAYASASQIKGMSLEALRKMNPDGAEEEFQQAYRVGNLLEFQEYQDRWGREGTEAVFPGPMAVLTSRQTVSAAEDFAAFFRSNHRATLIGEPTCGTSGTPLLQKLSCGTLRVCSVGYRLLDGTEWLGKGIQPDILIAPKEEDVCRNRDVVLETALACLK